MADIDEISLMLGEMRADQRAMRKDITEIKKQVAEVRDFKIKVVAYCTAASAGETYPSASNSSLHGTCRIVGATTSANSHGIVIHRSIFQYKASALTLIDTAVSSYDSTTKRQYDSIKVDNGIINFTAQGSIRLYGLNRA